MAVIQILGFRAVVHKSMGDRGLDGWFLLHDISCYCCFTLKHPIDKRQGLFLLRSLTETQLFVNELSTEGDSSSKNMSHQFEICQRVMKEAALMSRHMKIVGTPQTPNSSKLKHDFVLVWKCGKVLVLCAAWKHIAIAIVFTTDFSMETAWGHLAAVLPLKLVFAVVIHH